MISVTIKNLQNNDEFEIPFNSITIDDELNIGRSVRLTLEYRSIKDIADYYNSTVETILSGGQREIIIKKDTSNIFIGLITDFTLSEDNQNGMKLDIAGVSYFSVLTKRRTDDKRIFISTDAGSIAWTLINESQLSDPPYSNLGITLGTIVPSVNRDLTYRFANIKQEITNLSNKTINNGFDFDIDNTKVFNVFYPQKGSQRPDIVLDEVNILAWALRKPLILSLTNKVYVIGQGFNDNVAFSVRNSPASYKTTFGLLEDILSARNETNTTNLNDLGDKYLLNNEGPLLGININHLDGQPDMLTYEVGDQLRFTIPELALYQAYRRIYKRNIKIDINSTPVIQLEVR